MDNRLVVILGMAHSGTRVFARILLQSNKIKLLVNGPESHLLENDYLLHQNANGINKVLLSVKEPKYILVKRAWTERYWDFFKESFPNANYFIMLKTFEEQSKSWSKPLSLIGNELRNSKEEQKRIYNLHRNWAVNFPLPHKIINYNELLVNPFKVFDEVGKQLDLGCIFNVQEIDNYRRANEKLAAIRRK